jgi:hypothetical protein
VGKTRLITEMIAQAPALGAVTLAGGCLDIGDGVLAYTPLVEALRSLTALLDAAELDRVLGGSRAELARLVPELGPPVAEADPAAPARLFELLLGVLQRLTERGPVLLVVEDRRPRPRGSQPAVAQPRRGLPGLDRPRPDHPRPRQLTHRTRLRDLGVRRRHTRFALARTVPHHAARGLVATRWWWPDSMRGLPCRSRTVGVSGRLTAACCRRWPRGALAPLAAGGGTPGPPQHADRPPACCGGPSSWQDGTALGSMARPLGGSSTMARPAARPHARR